MYIYIYVIVKWGLTHIWKFIHGAPLFLFVALFAYSYIYTLYYTHEYCVVQTSTFNPGAYRLWTYNYIIYI